VVERQAVRRLAVIMFADMVGWSRLVEADEAGTLARQTAHRRELVDPAIARHGGDILKTTGDGVIVTFASALEATQCALEIQSAMAGREADRPAERRIAYRIGIHLGDMIFEGGDVFGAGVNIAARLQGLADPNGVCVSDVVHQSVEGHAAAPFRSFGKQRVKNLARPIHVWRWCADAPAFAAPEKPAEAEAQRIRFCRAPDGVQIAYALTGAGPPLVKAPNWMNHLDYEWRSPVWRHLLLELGRDRRLLRFDQRGNGLSDWDVPEISLESWVDDLAAVIEAAGIGPAPLLGISQGCAISIAYAARHPERVSALVLYGGYLRGRRRRGSLAEAERADAFISMIRHGWGQHNPAFRQLFTSSFMPEATPEQQEWFNELQKVSVDPETAARIRDVNEDVDVSALAPGVEAPALVLHCREDGVVPFEEGRRIAAMLPNARFVALEGRNHPLMEQGPAFPRFLAETRAFLAELGC
jgi:class 3 adenylate cyclase/pimeloyl-ACP methyl ester carboxylesterase